MDIVAARARAADGKPELIAGEARSNCTAKDFYESAKSAAHTQTLHARFD